MDLLIVVSAFLCLLLRRPAPQRLLHIDFGVLAAHHETDLTGGVCGDSGETVLSNREDFAARLLNVFDQVKVEPLVLGCRRRELWLAWWPMLPWQRMANLA